ncbi:MAG: hypothetical protein HZA50_06245 [Planctomycetes bacterium]|nr:hypothetical protein [Planctomycetota bacterium]
MPDDETEHSFQPPPSVAPGFAGPPQIESGWSWRKIFTLALLLLQIIPVFLVVLMWFTASQLEGALSDMGIRLTEFQRFVINTHNYWIIVPPITIVMSFLSFRNDKSNKVMKIVAFILTWISSIFFFLMYASLLWPLMPLIQAAYH